MEHLNQKIKELFVQKGWTLSLAESCTGGALSATLVAVPDSSHYFLGSLVAYSVFAKENILRIPSSILQTYGEVSAETALEMAKGALALFNSDVALAITGIAGPAGGSAEKPVGTVYLACSTKSGFSKHFKLKFLGDRQSIIEQTVERALSELERIVSN